MNKIYTGEVFRGSSFTPSRTYDVFEEDDYLLWELTQGQFTKVDKELFDSINNITWGASKATNVTGWYVYGGGTNKLPSFKMHQYLAGCERLKVDFEIDHINRNSLDNRCSNLRAATRRQQQFNQPRSRTGPNKETPFTSKFKGVRLTKSGKWQAVCNRLGGKLKCLPYMNNQEDAAIAWDEFMYEEYLGDDPLKGLELTNGIISEPTINFIQFNFPDRLAL